MDGWMDALVAHSLHLITRARVVTKLWWCADQAANGPLFAVLLLSSTEQSKACRNKKTQCPLSLQMEFVGQTTRLLSSFGVVLSVLLAVVLMETALRGDLHLLHSGS